MEDIEPLNTPDYPNIESPSQAAHKDIYDLSDELSQQTTNFLSMGQRPNNSLGQNQTQGMNQNFMAGRILDARQRL